MRHRVAIACLLVLACAAASSAPAAAGSLTCTPTITKLRYRPQIRYACAGGSPLASVSTTVVRLPANTPVASTPAWSGTRATVDLASLAPSGHYQIAATLTDGLGDVTTVTSSWTTLPPPAHPRMTVEYLTAIDPAALRDMLHRIDAANLVAVPSDARVIDASRSPLGVVGLESALNGRQVALVVGGDEGFAHAGWLGRALAWFAARGHGVVTAGQTHWLMNEAWPHNSAVGAQTAWDTRWDVFGDNAMSSDRIRGGSLMTSSVVRHFITAGLLKRFRVIGPGSGEVIPHFVTGSHVLAALQRTSSGLFSIYPQALLTVRQVGGSRLVDLGYRPWSSAVARGGFDPAVSAGGAILARSLVWATNRIPPSHTHFTTKPANPSGWATVTFGFAASDLDLDHPGALRFRYRLDGGTWRWASGNAAVFYNLAKGRRHTVAVYAVDSGGNRDPHTALYRFLVAATAR